MRVSLIGPGAIGGTVGFALAESGKCELTICANRPFEWDARNGVVQRLGKMHGIATPVADTIVPILKAMSDGPA